MESPPALTIEDNVDSEAELPSDNYLRDLVYPDFYQERDEYTEEHTSQEVARWHAAYQG